MFELAHKALRLHFLYFPTTCRKFFPLRKPNRFCARSTALHNKTPANRVAPHTVLFRTPPRRNRSAPCCPPLAREPNKTAFSTLGSLFNLFIISSTKRPSTFILITLKKVYPKPARFASNCGLFAPRSRRILSKITKNASYYFLFRCFSAFIVIYS